jgi:hypothetical protein
MTLQALWLLLPEPEPLPDPPPDERATPDAPPPQPAQPSTIASTLTTASGFVPRILMSVFSQEIAAKPHEVRPMHPGKRDMYHQHLARRVIFEKSASQHCEEF